MKRLQLKYTGISGLPRIVTGPVTKQHYLINPGNTLIAVDERDATVLLDLTGDVRFERG